MSRRRLPLHTFPLSHLDRTNFYERVVASVGGSPFQAAYAELVAVSSGGQTTIACPVVGGTEATSKDTFHFGVVSADGTGPITIQGGAHNINGAASIVIPALAGASAHLYFSNVLGEWVAFLGAGLGSFTPPPTYTARGPVAPQTFDNSAPTAVTGATVTTAPFTAGQKAIITASATMHNATAGSLSTAICDIFDGIPANAIDTFEQDLDPGDAAENIDHQTISWTTEVVGNGGARTFGLAIVAGSANNVVVEAQRCRVVVQIVDG
jgi:hypothetical protein